MAGHVNMMDDVLVSNLSPTILRSALRLLISQGSATQKPFVQHVRQRLAETKPGLTTAAELFPGGCNEASLALTEYLATVRCLFSCKLVDEALPCLSHLCQSIVLAKATWRRGSSLELVLATAGGDIVQAVQALKEAKTSGATEGSKAALKDLLQSLEACRKYCQTAGVSDPFARSARQVRDVLAMLYPALLEEVPSVGAGTMLTVTPKSDVKVETFQLGPFTMPRLFNGLWQLSSPAWGAGTSEAQTDCLVELVEAGLTAADMADHYGDAELVYGDFRNRLPATIRPMVFCATKWCVFRAPEVPVTAEWVLDNVKERVRRVGGRVDLLQLHWQDYSDKDYLDVLAELVRLSRAQPTLVAAVGLCNFDAEHMAEACEYLLQTVGAVGIVSNQVQYSLFDSRPRQKMAQVCSKYGLQLLTYGSFCGGMLADRWLGQPMPEIYAADAALTPSQRKYIDIIRTWSSWDDFQKLLVVLASIGQMHGVSLTNVATRWVLQQPAVGAVIVGTRLGVSSRWQENVQVFGWALDEKEMARINEMALGVDGEKSRRMLAVLGDCGSEYREH